MNTYIKSYIAPFCAAFVFVGAQGLALASSPAPEKAPPADTSYRAQSCADFYGDQFQSELDTVTESTKVEGNEVILSQYAAENMALRQQMMGDAERFVFLYTLILEPNNATTEQIATMIERANPPVDASGYPTREAVEVDERRILND